MTELGPSQLELPFPDVTGARLRELEALVARTTDDLIRRAREKWPQARIPRGRITFRMRGLSAGEACRTSGQTNYNSELLERYGEDFIREIVPHEVAHVVTSAVWPRAKPHGPEWRSVMEFFGARPSVTHGFDSKPSRRVSRIPYACACPEHHLMTRRAHVRIQRGTVEYSCRKCRRTLVYVGRGRGGARRRKT